MTSPENSTGQDPQFAPIPTPPLPTPPGPVGTAQGTDPFEGTPAYDPGVAAGDSPTGSGTSTAETAKGEGQQVAREAKEGGQQVAGVAKEEAGKVASTVGDQAKSLLSQGKSELSEQAGTQQQRLAGAVRSLGEELEAMASGAEQSGPATDLARQASQRSQGLASWLEDTEPGAALDEVRRFAQRRPGTFILVAAGVGLLAGRLTRGLTADRDDSQGSELSVAPRPGSGTEFPAWTAPEPMSTAPDPLAPVGAPAVPPVGGQPGLAEDTLDYPGRASGYPEDTFGVERPVQDGPGPR